MNFWFRRPHAEALSITHKYDQLEGVLAEQIRSQGRYFREWAEGL